MSQHQALLAFNAGEVTPYLRHRTDFDKAASSAELMENFIAQPYGGVMKRPGLRYITETEVAGKNSRLLPWVSSNGDKFLLHFTELQLTIYTPAGVLDEQIDFLETIVWPSPFSWDISLRNLQMVQVNDVAFLTHPLMFPKMISKAGSAWLLEFVPFTNAPMLDSNDDESLLMAVYSDPRKAKWVGGTNYNAGVLIERLGGEWLSLQTHTANADNMPGNGTGAWKDYWSRRMFVAGDPVTLVFNGLNALEWSGENEFYQNGTARVFRPDAVGGLGTQHGGSGVWEIRLCQLSHSYLEEGDEINNLSLGASAVGLIAKWNPILPFVPYAGGGVYVYAAEDQLCWHNKHLYRAKVDDFPMDPGSEPGGTVLAGDGSRQWKTFWEIVDDLLGLVYWNALPATIPKGLELAVLDGDNEPVPFLYRARRTHSRSKSRRPPGITEAPVDDWEIDWLVIDHPASFDIPWVYKFYKANDRVHLEGVVYKCLGTHFALTKNRPGSGDDWEDYWIALADPPAIFDPLHAASAVSPGSHWTVAPEREKDDFQVEIAAVVDNDNVASPYIAVDGAWTFNTFGIWYGVFQLERSSDGGTLWEVTRSWQAAGDRNVADSGFELEPVFLRLRFLKEDGGTDETEEAALNGRQRGVLTPESPFVTGIALADTWISSNIMTGIAQTSILSGRSWRWTEGAFSGYRGFPRALALHETRLCFAGTAYRPVSMWLSQTDDLLNFEIGAEATDGLFVSLAISAASPIRWLASQRRLFLGTALGEWVTGSETSDQPLTPTNFIARQYSGYGSLPHQPLIANDAIFFAERKGTRLRELSYFSDREAYDAADLSRLAEHLTAPGISNFAYQQTREPGLWVVRRDGVLLHFAYSRTERVSAWSRHTTQAGLFRDVAILPSDAGDDEVFFIVDRGAVSCLERFPQHWQEAIESASASLGFFHVDGVAGSGTTITIPAHLVNVAASRLLLAAGTPNGTPVASTVTMTGTTAAIANSFWQTGFPVVARLTSLPIDQGADNGTTQGRSKRMHKVLTSLVRSRGGHVWNLLESKRQPIVNTSTDLLRTGWEETIPDSGTSVDMQFHLYHADPYPFVLRSAVLRWELHEP